MSTSPVVLDEHIRMARRMSKKYGRRSHDCIAAAYYVLVRQSSKIHSAPNPTAYALKCMENAMKKALRNKEPLHRVALDMDIPAPDLSKHLERVRQTARDHIDEKIIDLRLQGYRDVQIADRLGISRTVVQERRSLMYKRFCK